MDAARIDPGASIGRVELTVSDLERSVAFYRDAMGLTVHAVEDGTARLGTGQDDLIGLVESPGARRAARATGLFHFAILLPSRADLARAILRVIGSGARLGGASDHGVSEALYLADPDGNGIEIYRDRPRKEWPRDASGSVQMGTEPLDLEGLMLELPPGERTLAAPGRPGPGRAASGAQVPPAPEDTRIGHIHLHVTDLAAAEHFYVGVLGFSVMARYGGEAVFVAAGGYHHHVGLNTWAGVGALPPPPGSAGLRWFEIRHTSDEERERTAARVREAGIEVEDAEGGTLVRDPSRNAMLLTAGYRTSVSGARASSSSARSTTK
jgi:catechol 2,3-dioxygenase